jgi:putative oxidoreductase
MKIATIIARILLGLIFVVFGSNFFLHFIPMPPPPPGLAGDYFKVFAASGQMYVIGAMQLLSGLLLLIGRFVPLSLTVLAAMIFNILIFHILMAPEGLPMATVVAVLELFLVWSYRDRFAGILRP